MRDTLGTSYELSFAAGGFDRFLKESIEWEKVMPLLDKVNIMSYDLVHGFSTMTGHHTPLYSSPGQQLSADHAIQWLDSIGVPVHKLILGAAFYARIWEGVAGTNHGLFQKGRFKNFVAFHQFQKRLAGFNLFTDSNAMAPYAYHPLRKEFATFDDSLSVSRKTKYVIEKGLGGIMFWELSLDRRSNGLVEAIHKAQ